jgi:hypothetical protein
MPGSDEAPQMPKASKHEDDNHCLELVLRHAIQALHTARGEGQIVMEYRKNHSFWNTVTLSLALSLLLYPHAHTPNAPSKPWYRVDDNRHEHLPEQRPRCHPAMGFKKGGGGGGGGQQVVILHMISLDYGAVLTEVRARERASERASERESERASE